MQSNEARTGQGVYIWENGALVYLTTLNGTPHHAMAEDDEDWDDDDEWDDDEQEEDDEDWDDDDEWDDDEQEEDDEDWDDDEWGDEDDEMVRGRTEPIRRRAPAVEPRHSKLPRHRPRVRQRVPDAFDTYSYDDE